MRAAQADAIVEGTAAAALDALPVHVDRDFVVSHCLAPLCVPGSPGPDRMTDESEQNQCVGDTTLYVKATRSALICLAIRQSCQSSVFS